MQLVHVLLFLSLCHSADVTRESDQESTIQVKSADEKCLIKFTRFMGVEFRGYEEGKVAMVFFDGKLHKF